MMLLNQDKLLYNWVTFRLDKCREKFVILKSIGIIAIKSSETRSVIYTCRYSSGNFFNPYNSANGLNN